jgi:hypothetical protein
VDIAEACLYLEGPAAAPRGWKGQKGQNRAAKYSSRYKRENSQRYLPFSRSSSAGVIAGRPCKPQQLRRLTYTKRAASREAVTGPRGWVTRSRRDDSHAPRILERGSPPFIMFLSSSCYVLYLAASSCYLTN